MRPPEAAAPQPIRLDEPERRRREETVTPEPEPAPVVAYFSMEFMLSETLPIYSGGLGILAGDHCKAASDLGIPFVGLTNAQDTRTHGIVGQMMQCSDQLIDIDQDSVATATRQAPTSSSRSISSGVRFPPATCTGTSSSAMISRMRGRFL